MVISLHVRVDMSENSQNMCQSVFQVGPDEAT